MENEHGFIIIGILLLLIYLGHSKRGYFSLPSDKELMAQDIIKNKDLFVGQNYVKLKSAIPWMDAGIYNDVKQLIRDKKVLNSETLSVIFRQ
jgi:hypothetical protein